MGRNNAPQTPLFGSILSYLAKQRANGHKYADVPLTCLRAIAIIRPVPTIPL